MEDLKKELESFLRYVSKECTDSYGHLEVVDTDDEKTHKEYYSQTVEGIVEEYLKNKKVK
jgi:hypothetical protein